jgi:predicted phosphodiesterase
MRVAIISDIHSNLEALEAVIADARKKSVSHFVVMGDIVGYGPNPNECVKKVMELDPSISILGNHDLFCTGVKMDMNPIAQQAVDWTIDHIDDNVVQYLRRLPMTAMKSECIFVHSTLFRPATFGYFMFNERDFHFLEQISTGKKMCFVGHTHRPEMAIWSHKEESAIQASPLFHIGKMVDVDPDVYTTVNVGSVGQPRDNQWKATYVICDMKNWSPKHVMLRRVEYDVEKTVKKIVDSSLPNYCGERLLHYKN